MKGAVAQQILVKTDSSDYLGGRYLDQFNPAEYFSAVQEDTP
jgi:hypothetical protein